MAVDRCIECKQTGADDWVQCDRCDGWVHFACSGRCRAELQARDASYVCVKCAAADTRPKRRRTEVNYARLHRGIMEVSQTHPHVQFFAAIETERPQFGAAEHAATKINAAEEAATEEFHSEELSAALDHFFVAKDARPLCIPKRLFPLLEMEIEADHFTPRAIAATLGEDTPAPVMDSVTQFGVKGWTLGRWRDYHELGPQRRRNLTRHGTLNVITLEFSSTPLADHVRRPRRVRDADLVDHVWPSDRPKPKVQLYSLTGAANSFTDFHIDFAGSSVFYHLISGAKSFVFVEPTPRNLKLYEKWCGSAEQTETWFPSLLKNPTDAFQVDVQAGDSLLIPSGWIHAVYTPSDAVVVGGNFLTLKDMDMQRTIAELEERTSVPKRFRFPMFAQVLKYTDTYLQREDEKSRPPNDDVKIEAASPHYINEADADADVRSDCAQNDPSRTDNRTSGVSAAAIEGDAPCNSAEAPPECRIPDDKDVMDSTDNAADRTDNEGACASAPSIAGRRN